MSTYGTCSGEHCFVWDNCRGRWLLYSYDDDDGRVNGSTNLMLTLAADSSSLSTLYS